MKEIKLNFQGLNFHRLDGVALNTALHYDILRKTE